MHRYRRLIGMLGMVVLLLMLWGTSALAAGVARMSSDELRDRLGEANLVVLDVRTAGDYARNETQIEGAVRVDPNAALSWAGSFDKGATIVLYCA